MKTFNVLDVTLIVGATLLITMTVMGSMFVVEYNKQSAKLSTANAVIEEFIEDNTDYFLDVMCETDVWNEYQSLNN